MATSYAKRAPGVVVVEVSSNRKLGLMSATYLSPSTCSHPDGTPCPLLGHGCYTEAGPTNIIARGLKNTSPGEALTNEAALVSSMEARLDLRLHVVGDCPTEEGANMLGDASSKYSRKRRKKVLAYTHWWSKVHRKNWGSSVSVLSSCEDAGQLAYARDNGYHAGALVVRKFWAKSAYPVTATGSDGRRNTYTLIPCPNQTSGVTCSTCMLCFDEKRLGKNNLVIGFEAHGRMSKKIPLPVLTPPPL